jgi:hypothetical protein
MADWPQHYRDDIGITERICPHGIGHPDPDDIYAQGHVHGCDGCCGMNVVETEEEQEPKISWFRRIKKWIRQRLCEDYHYELGEHYIEVLGEIQTLEEEVVFLQEWVRLSKQAMKLHEEVREVQELEIEVLTELLAISQGE